MGGGLFLMSEVPLYTHPQRLFYRVTSLIRAPPTPGPNSRPMHKALWGSQGGRFLMSEVPLWGLTTAERSRRPLDYLVVETAPHTYHSTIFSLLLYSRYRS